MKTVILPVTVHSCLLSFDIQVRKNLIPGEKYLSMADGSPWFRLLPPKCRCRKMVTQRDAETLVEDGVAETIWRVKKGRIDIDYAMIWMAQQRQVPRVDMITKADIERAFVDETQTSIDNIEEIHLMIIANRAKLIVPFDESKHIGDYPLNGKDKNGDITAGRLIFPFRHDERTPGGHAA
jgi:hypothetical protein